MNQKNELESNLERTSSGLRYWKSSLKTLTDLDSYLEVSWEEANAFLMNSCLERQFDKLSFQLDANVNLFYKEI